MNAVTRFSKKFRTSLKLNLPILHDPSTRMTMSAMAGVSQKNFISAKVQTTIAHTLLSEPFKVQVGFSAVQTT